MPNSATAEMPFFLVYGRDPNLPLHQLLEPTQQFLGDPDSGMLNLEAHRLTLAIAKKTLDENHFKSAQNHGQDTTFLPDRRQSIFQKTSSPANGTLNGDLDIELSELSMMDTSYTLKTRLQEEYEPVM